MSSATIAGQISQCDSNIRISEEKVARLEKELAELNYVEGKQSSQLIKLEDDYDARKRRLDSISLSYQKAKGGRTYHEGMTFDMPEYKTKVMNFSAFLSKIQNDITKKNTELEQEKNYLNQLRTQRDSLQSSYNQAVWDEEQEKIKNQAIWDAQQEKNKGTKK